MPARPKINISLSFSINMSNGMASDFKIASSVPAV